MRRTITAVLPRWRERLCRRREGLVECGSGGGIILWGAVSRSACRARQVAWIQPGRKGFDAGLEMPDLVLTSKPDVYDAKGWLAEFLARLGSIRRPH